MEPRQIIRSGLLFLSLSIIVSFLPSVGLLSEQFPAMEVGVMLAILAIFFISIGARRLRGSETGKEAENDDVLAAHMALDLADGKLDGQYFSPHDE